MDTRAVEAKAPEIDPAEEAKRLDAAVEEARIGIGYINVLYIYSGEYAPYSRPLLPY